MFKMIRYHTYSLQCVWTRRFMISLCCFLCLLLVTISSYTDLLPLGRLPADQPSVMCSFGEGNFYFVFSRSHGTYRNKVKKYSYLSSNLFLPSLLPNLISNIFREAREPDVFHRHNVQLLQTVRSQVLRHPGTWMCQLIEFFSRRHFCKIFQVHYFYRHVSPPF